MLHGRFRVLAVAVVAIAPFSLAACGGDDDAAGGGAVRQQVIDQMTEGGDGPTAEQAGCMADGLLASLGEGRVKELLALGEDVEIEEALSPDEQSKFASAAVACIDAKAMVREQLTGTGFSEDDANCIIDAIGDDNLQALIEAGMTGGAGDQSAITDAVLACGVAP